MKKYKDLPEDKKREYIEKKKAYQKLYLSDIKNKEKHNKSVMKYNKKNRLKLNEYQREKYKRERENPEFRKNKSVSSYKYAKDHPIKNKRWRRNYQINKYQTDPHHQLMQRLRRNTNRVFRHYIKTKKMLNAKAYGIDYAKIIDNLRPFPKDILEKEYEIHHKEYLKNFKGKLLNEDGSLNINELKKAFAPENHILLSKEEHRKIHGNISKKAKRINKNI